MRLAVGKRVPWGKVSFAKLPLEYGIYTSMMMVAGDVNIQAFQFAMVSVFRASTSK